MGEGEGQPVSIASALGMLDRALNCLTTVDTAGLPAAVQAEALLALERAEARHTAARARLLTSFTSQGGYEDDGHGSARAWLRWRARITAGAAAGAVGWARRLAAHPVIAAELAAGDLSESWAIPAHLRRTTTTRHTHCAFPGCRVPAEACHIHHLVPRARGGPTAIGNLVPLCSFHHLTVIHRWGWTLALRADGGITATSPDRARTLHDHDPPQAAA